MNVTSKKTWEQVRKYWKIAAALVCVILILTLGIVYILCYESKPSYPKPLALPSTPEELEAYAIEEFREYLRIPSVHPNIDYKPCVAFLKRQAKTIDLPIQIHYPSNEQTPLVILTWAGSNQNLPSIVLNSHMDVVPVYEDQWTHPPFAAEMDNEGRIFGRGAQDNKSPGTQYLAAIRALKMAGIKQLNRTIHIIFSPDEEISGNHGWKSFINSDEFKALNVGFFLDEGTASETQQLDVYYAERNAMKVHIDCVGETGHGSLILPNTAAEKAHYMINKMLHLRALEARRLKDDPSLTVGDVTTINLTILKGGVQSNVVPADIKLAFDVRLAIDVDQGKFVKMIDQWAVESGENVTVTYRKEEGQQIPTVVGSKSPYWVALEDATKRSNLTIIPRVLGPAGDGRFIRRANIPALGFSPMSETPVLMHCHDEYITANTYLKGIKVYEKIILNLGNLE